MPFSFVFVLDEFKHLVTTPATTSPQVLKGKKGNAWNGDSRVMYKPKQNNLAIISIDFCKEAAM